MSKELKNKISEFKKLNKALLDLVNNSEDNTLLIKSLDEAIEHLRQIVTENANKPKVPKPKQTKQYSAEQGVKNLIVELIKNPDIRVVYDEKEQPCESEYTPDKYYSIEVFTKIGTKHNGEKQMLLSIPIKTNIRSVWGNVIEGDIIAELDSDCNSKQGTISSKKETVNFANKILELFQDIGTERVTHNGTTIIH